MKTPSLILDRSQCSWLLVETGVGQRQLSSSAAAHIKQLSSRKQASMFPLCGFYFAFISAPRYNNNIEREKKKQHQNTKTPRICNVAPGMNDPPIRKGAIMGNDSRVPPTVRANCHST